MEKRIIDIVIGNRIRKDVGNLETLKESIRKTGLLHPIVIDKENNLIAGLRRLNAFKQLKLKNIPVSIIDINNLNGEIDENIERKDFVASEIYEIEKIFERKKGNQYKVEVSESDSSTRRKSLDKITGVSHDTRNKIKKIIDSEDNNLIEELDKTGNINKVSRKLRIKEFKNNFKAPILPKGEFNIIYADPPWKYDFIGTDNRKIENKYNTMELEDIKNLQVPSSKDSVLLLWATAPKLQEALEVMKSWGFKYKTCAVWDKELKGMGYWFRGQHELLLIGTKGDFSPPFEEHRFSSIYRERRTEHSKKPEFYYKMIETMFPKGKLLELFARNKRNNWTSWGNEL